MVATRTVVYWHVTVLNSHVSPKTPPVGFSGGHEHELVVGRVPPHDSVFVRRRTILIPICTADEKATERADYSVFSLEAVEALRGFIDAT